MGIGLIIGFILGALFSGLVIWVVSKLGLGLQVDGFGSAFVAAIVIAIISILVTWLFSVLGITIGGGLLGAIIQLIVAAVVLMVADKFLKGLKVHGFTGALVAAVAIAAVTWLIGWVVSILL